MTRTHDDLIIGAGLAGSILAWNLLEGGRSVLIVQDPAIASASRAAAGLINPVTGQRLVLQENIGELLESAHRFYGDIESRFNCRLLHEKEMLRLFRNDREKTAWEKRRSNPAYRPYLSDELHGDNGFIQHRTGWLDTNGLLDLLHSRFRQESRLIEEPFDHGQLIIRQHSVTWREVEAADIIFCEGWHGMRNPWFGHLPFQPAKGEILSLKGSASLPQRIINRGKWLLPLDRRRFKLGATYDWHNLDEEITAHGRQELLSSLADMPVDQQRAEVTGHIAGVRPGTVDKHPFVGHHSTNDNCMIFNGFGSKGSLLIPWHAERFAAHLTSGEPVPSHADIARFDG